MGLASEIIGTAREVLDQSWTVRALEKVNATLAAETAHLRAQRDQLQRDNTRFQQEARDARERARVAEQELYEIHAPTKVEPRWTWIEYPDGEYLFGRFDEYGDLVEGQPVMRLCREGDQWLGKIRSRGDGSLPLRLFAPHGLGIEASAVSIAATWVNLDELPPGDTVDMGVFSKWTRPAVEAPPVVETAPSYVARWVRDDAHNRWALSAIGAPDSTLAWMHPPCARGDKYLAMPVSDDYVTLEYKTVTACTENVEAYLRCLDMLPDGPVDRSALSDVTS